MIVGIGTDLLHVPRIKALIAKRGAPTLARRILSPRELTEFKALIRGKLNLPSSSSASTSISTSKTGAGAGAGAGTGTGVKGTANGDNAERTSFRTVLKGLNRNIENEEVTRFLASRWAAKEAAYKALYPLYVTAQGSSSSSSSNGNNTTTTSSAGSSTTTTTTTFTSSSSMKPYTSLPSSPSFPSSSSSSAKTSSSGDDHPRLSPNLTWKSVDLHYTQSKPYLRYTYGYGTTHDLERDSDVRKLRMPRLHVSLSHDGEYVSAVVVAEEQGEGGSGSGEGRGGGKKEGKGGTVLREYR